MSERARSEDYRLTVELPGFEPDDVRVELLNDVLTIQGEKRESFEEERSRGSERSCRQFVQSFTLPSDADVDGLEASFSEGLLAITIPRRESSQPRTIDIETPR